MGNVFYFGLGIFVASIAFLGALLTGAYMPEIGLALSFLGMAIGILGALAQTDRRLREGL